MIPSQWQISCVLRLLNLFRPSSRPSKIESGQMVCLVFRRSCSPVVSCLFNLNMFKIWHCWMLCWSELFGLFRKAHDLVTDEGGSKTIPTAGQIAVLFSCTCGSSQLTLCPVQQDGYKRWSQPNVGGHVVQGEFWQNQGTETFLFWAVSQRHLFYYGNGNAGISEWKGDHLFVPLPMIRISILDLYPISEGINC